MALMALYCCTGLTQEHSESCRKWLHTSCVNLGHHNLPSVYLCAFCTDTPRAVRGTRNARESAKASFQPAGGSPLAYKGQGRFR